MAGSSASVGIGTFAGGGGYAPGRGGVWGRPWCALKRACMPAVRLPHPACLLTASRTHQSAKTQSVPPRTPAADELLASKRNRDLLEPYDERLAAAVGYMQMVNPEVRISAGPLSDPKVRAGACRCPRWALSMRGLRAKQARARPAAPCCLPMRGPRPLHPLYGCWSYAQCAAPPSVSCTAPRAPLPFSPSLKHPASACCHPAWPAQLHQSIKQEPPLCATDPDFDAIVVSEETVPGAHAINKASTSQLLLWIAS